MKPVTIAAGLVLAVAVAGCTPPSHRAEALELRDRLRGLPGVEGVTLRYDGPITLDAADVDLDVVMVQGATSDEMAAVVETAYAGLVDAHHEEEGNVTVARGDDAVDMRTFDSEAEVADVVAAAATGLEFADRGELDVFLGTQWVENAPHVNVVVRLHPGHRPSRGEIGRLRTAIEQAYGELPMPVDAWVYRR